MVTHRESLTQLLFVFVAVCGKHAVVMTMLLGAGSKMDGHTPFNGGLVRDKLH